MIDFSLDEKASVLTVRPAGPLSEADFDALSKAIDPFIDRTGGLHGIMLEVQPFPGWADWGSVVRHVRFVRGHHRDVGKVAVVTDSMLGKMAENIASFFVHAEIRHFPSVKAAEARDWLES